MFVYFVQYKKWTIVKSPISLIERKVKKNKVFTSLGSIFGVFLILNLFLSDFINFQIVTILSILFVIGFLDDIINFSIFTKTFLLFFTSLLVGISTELNSLELLIGKNIVLLFTVLLFFYFINANNFLDGLDGYLSQHYLFFILYFFIILFNFNGIINIQYFLILTLPIIIFLYYNLKGICMMGDCGSMLLGATIFFLNLIVLKNHYYIEFIIINIYLFTEVPLTILKRLFNGRNMSTRDFDYSFLKLVINNNKEHIYVFNKFFIYNISILIALLISLYSSKLLGVILSLSSTMIYLLYLNQKIKNSKH
jgi:UDP-N-acetylmuramyl pentapeptide phosphotransferase/UDP-N-acetylglucosamine-1-phosphate transferase